MQALLNIAVSNALVATLLAVMVAVVARFCRSAVVRHALWLLVLLKLMTPPLVLFSVPWPQTEKTEVPSMEAPPPADTANGRPQLADEAPDQPADEPLNQPTDELPVRPADAGRSSHSSTEIAMQLLFAVWLTGSLAWWTLAAVRLRRFQRLLRQARPAPAEVQEQARRLAALLGVRRCPPVAFVLAPLSPMLWALGLSPRLLLPAQLWSRLQQEQQDTLLAHELAHLCRGDHWVRHLELLVLGLYWWHPVVWWARRRLQEAEEECCDALVIAVLPEAASAYASALVETVTFLSQSRATLFVGASGAGQVPLLKRRLTMILMATSPRRPSRLAFWTVLGLGALLLPLAPRAARTEVPEKPRSEEKKERSVAVSSGRPVKRVGIDANAPSKPQSGTQADHNQEIENLQDEIELLRLQVTLNEARLRGAKTSLPLAQKRLEWADRLRKGGTISEEEWMKSQAGVAASKADIEIKEVELQEAHLRLKQAERRLARLQRPAAKTDGGDRAQDDKRLQELEQKVENLLKEIHKMREDRRPNKPRDPALEHKEARIFIFRIWPILNTTRLEENIPKALKAFQSCKENRDRGALEELLKGTKGHADRLAKELAQLHPELVIEDEITAKKLKKVNEQIIKLDRDIESTLW